MVAACTSRNSDWPRKVWPKTILASWASTVGYPAVYGVAWVTCAIQPMPATRTPRMTPSVTSTLRAFLPSGGWKAPTASLTASMPVSDAPPLANARSSVKIITPVRIPSVPGPME